MTTMQFRGSRSQDGAPVSIPGGSEDPCARMIAVGQFPPPLTGLSFITQAVVERIRASQKVTVCNIAARPGAQGLAKHLSRIVKVSFACLSLIRARRRPRMTCYVACEGGFGILHIVVIVGAARLLGYPVVLHHHSFAYIDREYLLIRALLWVGGDLTHIFLCRQMRDRFEATYKRGVRSTILSNAAFVPPQSLTPSGPSDGIVLGHLSNLTREKGLHIFLDLLRAASRGDQNVRGVLAGPVAEPSDRAAIEEAVRELGERFEYRGPLYGAEKDRFYREVDVFVFPTRYFNEAQPTVLFEALAAGCEIVSFDRGCIAAQVGEDGLVVGSEQDFVAMSRDWLFRRHSPRDGARRAILERYIQRHHEANAALDHVFEDTFGAGAASKAD